jgi:hypothetical protein
MSIVIPPFQCNTNYLISCEKQKEAWDALVKLNTENKLLAPNSVAIGSGLGDASWNEALNYGKIQEEKSKGIIKDAEQKSVGYVDNLQAENKKKDYLIYGVALFLVLGVIIYEFKSKK